MRHVIIGTAGHVDHGKSALIHALTGIETDRLKEEKERGLSIELGFAYFDLPDGSRAGIVDVPGHERFIRNMLSGAYGMDMVLLVVDAKEGVQEQTLEHLEILDLLGISTGILVMTKVDLVTPDQLAESAEMSQEMLVGTTLEGSPTVHVSAITGEGLDKLKSTIVACVINTEAQAERHNGIPRLYVDRVFSMTGFGGVVTGTLMGGAIQREQRLVMLPQGQEVRVRGVQVHNEQAENAQSGQRTALNLSGITKDQIERGNVLCPSGFAEVTDNIDVSLDLLSSFPRMLEHWTRLRFYLGTNETFCRAILLMDEAVLPGDSTQLQLRLEKPILTFKGDRFIVRDFSAQHTVGGGRVINPFAPRHKRFTEETLETLTVWEDADDAEVVRLVLAQNRELCVPEEFLRYYLPYTDADFRGLLKGLEDHQEIVRWAGATPLVSAMDRTEQAQASLINALANFHEDQPLAPGQNTSQLRLQLKLDEIGFEKIVDQLIRQQEIVTDGNLLRLSSHQIQFSAEEEDIKEKVEGIFLDAGINTPAMTELTAQLSKYPPQSVQQTFYALMNLGRFIRIADDLFIHTQIFEEIVNSLTDYLQKNDIITVAEFRELAQTSRKYAVPFLEYCDGQGLTIREGNHRRLRRSQRRA
ncbi:selenocysteine-specific translation elongation factor [Candidatus Poribacteria bacterium]|nr:selenocysteine-specific translation elongation factor [Candidatus Poribacteria bacterium]